MNGPVDAEAHHLVSQFLYREARLLDERRYEDWLALWAEDASYLMPTTWVDGDHGLREADDYELHHLRSGHFMLQMRVQKLITGQAWAESPASRTVRTVSNIEVREDNGSLLVRSNIVLHRVRSTDDMEVHAASRSDVLRPHGSTWSFTRRRVLLAHGVLHAANLQFFL